MTTKKKDDHPDEKDDKEPEKDEGVLYLGIDLVLQNIELVRAEVSAGSSPNETVRSTPSSAACASSPACSR